MDKIVLQVEGMKCGGCESVVKSALEAAEGVAESVADHKRARVDVSFDSAVISVDQIKEIVANKGYVVKN